MRNMNALTKVVLKGSILALVAAGLATGCGTDKDDTTTGDAGDNGGGTKSTAGTKNNVGGGGAKSVGGASDGGAAAAPGGAASGGEKTAGGEDSGGAAQGGAAQGGAAEGGAAQGGADGAAVAKFCNGVELGSDEDGEGGAPPVSEDVTFRVELGEGDAMVSFTAKTGECAPVDGAACTPIPVGADVPYKMFDAETDTELDAGTIKVIADGEEWFFWSEIFEDFPVLSGTTDEDPETVCSEMTWDTIVPAP
jgi:hypothetical protein